MKKPGNTPLLKRKWKGITFLIKDESKNPFGTYKDRRSELIATKVAKRLKTLVIISYGNACYSLSRFAKNSRVICIVNKMMKDSIKKKLRKYASQVIETGLSKKKLSKKEIVTLVKEKNIMDVSNGFHKAYITIITEIKKEKPDYIVVPVGSGEAFVGLYEGIRKHKLLTTLIGIGVRNKYTSLADKLPTKYTPYNSIIKTITQKGHKVILLNEKEVRKCYTIFRKMVNCEPSSAVVLGALMKLHFTPKDKIILINSGRGIM